MDIKLTARPASLARRLTCGKIRVMETVTVSTKGQIAIPRAIREALNLSEGTKLNLDVRGHKIVLSKEPAWKKLRGTLAGNTDLMQAFAAHRRAEREREDAGS